MDTTITLNKQELQHLMHALMFIKEDYRVKAYETSNTTGINTKRIEMYKQYFKEAKELDDKLTNEWLNLEK